MAEKTKDQLRLVNDTNFPNNNTNFITPDKLRGFNDDMIDSIATTADSASFASTDNSLQNQIDALEEEPIGYVTNYQGIQIPYRSPEHYRLIERAIRAKVEQNPNVQEALVGREKHDRREITHILRREDGTAIQESLITSLPAEVFTTILMKIRQEMQNEAAS